MPANCGAVPGVRQSPLTSHPACFAWKCFDVNARSVEAQRLSLEFQDILHVVFLASLSFSFESQASTFSLSHQENPLHQHLNILLLRKWRSPSFSLTTRISPAFVDLQTVVTCNIVLHLLANPVDTLLREVLLSAHERQCHDNTPHSRLFHQTSSSLPS